MATITMTETASPAAAGDRFVASGLFVLCAVFGALQLLAGEVTVFWAIPFAVYAVLGLALLWRAPRWLLITTIVITVLQVGTSLPFAIPGLTHPETPASFLPEVLIVLGSLVVVSGAAVALPRSRRRGRRSIAVAAAVLAAVAVITSIVATSTLESVAAQPGDVPVVAANTAYPQRVEVQQGGALFVDNQDPFHHTFVIEGTDVNADLPGSAALRVDADLDPGTYTFFCDVTGHESMQGALIVQ